MKFNETLRSISIISLFAALFIPLIVIDSLFFPFIGGKNIFFRVFSEVAFASWIILAFRNKKYRPTFSWLSTLMIIFVSILFVAGMQGVAPLKSFWSNFERMEGIVTYIHLLIYFLTASVMLSSEGLWKGFLNTSIGVSLLVGLNGLAQLIGATSTRIDSTLGNPEYLASYIMFNIFFAIYLFFKYKGKKDFQRYYVGVIIFQLIVIYFANTRGVILGILGGVFTIALLLALFAKDEPKLKKASATIIVILLVAIAGLFLIRDTSFVKNNRVLSRFASISLDDSTTRSRFMVWNMAYQGFQERPILGWGQENFPSVYTKYYNPRMYDQEPWFDRAHNAFFDWLVAGGILGLAAYLALFVSSFIYLWKKKNNPFPRTEAVVLTGLLAGFFIQNQFVFDNIVSNLLLMTTFALIVATYQRANAPEAKDTSESGWTELGTWVLVIALCAGLYFTAVRPWLASTNLIQATRPQTGGLTVNTKFFNQALDAGPSGRIEIREQFLQTAKVASQNTNYKPDERITFLNAAADEFIKQIAETPTDVRELQSYGNFFNEIAYPEKGLPYLEKAHELAPNKQAVAISLINSYFLLKQYDKGLELAKKTYEVEKNNPQAQAYYAAAGIYNKNSAIVTELYGTTTPANRVIANAYIELGNFKDARASYSALILQNPADTDNYLLLVDAYLKEKNKAGAIAILRRIIEVNPATKQQMESIIKQVEEGKL